MAGFNRILIFIIGVLFIRKVSTSGEEHQNANSSLFQWYEALSNAEKITKTLTQSLMKYLLPILVNVNSEISITPKCSVSLSKLLLDFRRLHGWAIKMLDAMGKVPSGVLDGTVSEMGDYDECINIVAKNKRKKELFRGSYCIVEATPALPPKSQEREVVKQIFGLTDNTNSTNLRYSFIHHFTKIRYGICVPSACSKSDIDEIINGALRIHKLKFEISVSRCEVKKDYSVSTTHIVILSCFGVLLMLVLCGTLLDTLLHQTDISRNWVLDRILYVLCSFSIRINGNKLLSNKTSICELNALHGIRFITISWLILGDTYSFFHPQNYRGLNYVKNVSKEVGFQTILNAWVSIDTFYFMKLTPMLLVVIGMFLLLPLIGSGPVWEELVGTKIKQCEENWWATITYINNWRHYDQMCIQVSWYPSIDVQLHIFSLIILIPFFKNRKIGIAIGLLVTIGCASAVLVYMLVTDFYPSILLPDKDHQYRIIELYMKPYTHAGPFCIGLFTGYAALKYSQMKIRKGIQIFLWCGALISNALVVYLPYEQTLGYMHSPFEAAQYTAITRLCWAVALSWISYACISEKAGLLNKLLAFKLFIPLSRLAYCAYLLHELVLSSRYGLMRQTIIFNNYNMVCEFLSTFFIVFMLSVFCHLVVEAPFVRLKNYTFSRWYYYTNEEKSENVKIPKQHIQLKEIKFLKNDN